MPKPDEFTIYLNGKSITFRKGNTPGRVWIENESGTGGDFPEEMIFDLVRDLFDKSFLQ